MKYEFINELWMHLNEYEWIWMKYACIWIKYEWNMNAYECLWMKYECIWTKYEWNMNVPMEYECIRMNMNEY